MKIKFFFFTFYRLCIGINHVKSQLIIYIINRDIFEIIRLLKIKGVFSPPHKCLPHADTVRHPKDLNSARFNYLISWGCQFVLLNASVLLKEASFSETCSKLYIDNIFDCIVKIQHWRNIRYFYWYTNICLLLVYIYWFRSDGIFIFWLKQFIFSWSRGHLYGGLYLDLVAGCLFLTQSMS